MAAPAGIELFAVNPAYSSIWGEQDWRRPFSNVTRHQATSGSRGESYQPDRTRQPAGDHQ